MKDLVEVFTAYPTWVKVAVLLQMGCIAVLLVFFRTPAAAAAKESSPAGATAPGASQPSASLVGSSESLAKVLEARAAENLRVMSQVIARVRKWVKRREGKSLEDLQSEFERLHKEHVAAVRAGDVALAHELVGQIHDVQSEFKKLADTAAKDGGVSIRATASKRYIDAPEKGTDKDYDEAIEAAARFEKEIAVLVQGLQSAMPTAGERQTGD